MVRRQGRDLAWLAGRAAPRTRSALSWIRCSGLYLHIPFCGAICHYCNFNRGLLDAGLKARYVDALDVEIRRAADGSVADTIYFGGGTPSLLAPDEVARLIAACRESFAVTADAEVTLELNPETATPEYLAAIRAAGATRLSIGVQSFDDGELARLGRVHSADRAREAVRLARGAGFDDLSLDLMMWLPGQSVDRWLANVEALIETGPDHASLYILEIYPNAPLRDEMARGGWSQAPDDDAAEMYLRGLDLLDRAGYEHYEISNVARPGHQSRHNVKYWADGEWLAFGCGAHATRDGRALAQRARDGGLRVSNRCRPERGRGRPNVEPADPGRGGPLHRDPADQRDLAGRHRATLRHRRLGRIRDGARAICRGGGGEVHSAGSVAHPAGHAACK